MVETGVLVGERGAYRLEQALASLQVPATVQAVLAARIDRLPTEEKRLLQTAAVLGTAVPLSLLHAIADVPEAVLQRHLTALQSAEFLYETRLFPELEYTFKHALTHEVAYGSLLLERRRVLHARIVEALEALVGERLAEQVERLAQHALRGEVWDKALAYFRQAGEKAMVRSAHREAVGYLEQALSTLSHLPETHDTREQAIDLRLALRTALWPLGDVGHALAYLREAEALAEALDDPRRLGRVSDFLSFHCHSMGMYAQAITAAQRALALATISGDGVLQAQANEHLGIAYQAQGDYRRAIACFGQTVAFFDGTRHRERFGNVSCLQCSPVPTWPGAMPSWERSLRAGASGKKGSRLPRQLLTLAALCVPIGGLVGWPSAKVIYPWRSPSWSGPYVSVRTQTSLSCSPG